jgi:hypothetical protein
LTARCTGWLCSGDRGLHPPCRGRPFRCGICQSDCGDVTPHWDQENLRHCYLRWLDRPAHWQFHRRFHCAIRKLRHRVALAGLRRPGPHTIRNLAGKDRVELRVVELSPIRRGRALRAIPKLTGRGDHFRSCRPETPLLYESSPWTAVGAAMNRRASMLRRALYT